MADDKTTQTPPWGDDFDAETAWTLVQNLRGEVKGLKTDKVALKTERDAFEAKVTEFENNGKTAEELAATKAQADADALKAAQRELWTERALRKHGVPEELIEFLTGDDEEAILAKAEKLAGLKSASTPDPDDKGGDPTPPPSTRPASGLTPGHGGEETDPVNLDDIVASVL
jgi:hypothetical protein